MSGTKLNKTAYLKVALQAEEARDIGLKALADSVFGVIGPMPREEALVYGKEALAGDVRQALWKIATDVVAYHDIDSVDIQKIDGAIQALAETVIGTIEHEIGKSDEVGPLEPKLPGQK